MMTLTDMPKGGRLPLDFFVNSLQGLDEYHELTKADIDELIRAFKEIQEQLND